VAYGIVAGGVLVVALAAVGLGLDSATATLAVGLGYGVVLFVGAAAFWMTVVLDIDAELPTVARFLLFHLVYGAVLGGWLRVGLL
jgi:hypothetical protein